MSLGEKQPKLISEENFNQPGGLYFSQKGIANVEDPTRA